jgi:hypothetical protein
MAGLLAQFPFEGMRLNNWRKNQPTTFGSTLWVDSTFDTKADALTCHIYGARCVKPNVLVVDADNSTWDYLHPTRAPAFKVDMDPSGCHAVVHLPAGYRLAQAICTEHPRTPEKVRAQLLARDFFGKEVTTEVVLNVRLINMPDPTFAPPA